MLDQVVPTGIRMGERGLRSRWYIHPWTSHNNLPEHRLLGLFQKLGEVPKLVVVPSHTWAAYPRLAHTPSDTGPCQALRRGDDDLQLRLCRNLCGYRLVPANCPSRGHDPGRHLCAYPGQCTTPYSGFEHRHSKRRTGLDYFALSPVQTENAEDN